MSKPIGQAWPVELSNDVTLNMFRYYEDDIAYWLDIQGYRVPLTEKQYIALYEARIQVWDKATRCAEERIIKLLEDECSSDWPKVIEMPLGNLIALIKGEKNGKEE